MALRHFGRMMTLWRALYGRFWLSRCTGSGKLQALRYRFGSAVGGQVQPAETESGTDSWWSLWAYFFAKLAWCGHVSSVEAASKAVEAHYAKDPIAWAEGEGFIELTEGRYRLRPPVAHVPVRRRDRGSKRPRLAADRPLVVRPPWMTQVFQTPRRPCRQIAFRTWNQAGVADALQKRFRSTMPLLRRLRGWVTVFDADCDPLASCEPGPVFAELAAAVCPAVKCPAPAIDTLSHRLVYWLFDQIGEMALGKLPAWDAPPDQDKMLAEHAEHLCWVLASEATVPDIQTHAARRSGAHSSQQPVPPSGNVIPAQPFPRGGNGHLPRLCRFRRTAWAGLPDEPLRLFV